MAPTCQLWLSCSNGHSCSGRRQKSAVRRASRRALAQTWMWRRNASRKPRQGLCHHVGTIVPARWQTFASTLAKLCQHVGTIRERQILIQKAVYEITGAIRIKNASKDSCQSQQYGPKALRSILRYFDKIHKTHSTISAPAASNFVASLQP